MVDCLVINLYENRTVQISSFIMRMNFLKERNKFTILYNLINYLLMRVIKFS